jgi:coenzyme F420-reducing hydrogenase delta subunit/ferredoxin
MSEVELAGVDGGKTVSVSDGWRPHIVALVCNWCSYAGADMAGTTRLQYPSNVRMVRFPCTGRMSPLMILRAFEQGADGILVSGCHPGDCHYVQGNLVARRRFTIFRSLLEFLGIDMGRLHFAWVSAAEGHKWARVVEEVTAAVGEAGPLPKFGASDDWQGLDMPEVEGGGPPEVSADELAGLSAQLRQAAADLLSTGQVGAVIGYRAASMAHQMAPLTITAARETERLQWGSGCVNNLSTYASTALENHERVALVVKTCDLGAVTGLIREGQLPRDRVSLIGVQCPGVSSGSEIAAKCLNCSGIPHPICDVVVTVDGIPRSPATGPPDGADAADARDKQIDYLESLPADQRWRFWQRQFARCLRCYACRAACPLCYCSSCVAEKHRPQWISPVIDNRGNSVWNVIRAFHLAGRCSGCDECARACPADIRLDLINRKLALEVERQYGACGLDPEEKTALVDFREDDSEEFIL